MSIGALSVGEAPVAAQSAVNSGTKAPAPSKRTIVATPDTVAQPEPR